MNSFELNKIMGAVLGALLFVVGMGILSDIVFEPEPAGIAGYALPLPEGAETEVAEAAPAEEPLPILLASADVGRGEAAVRKCASCHSFDQGGANGVGPNLYDIVGGPKAHLDNFGYSSALAERGAAGEVWGYDELYAFLENPRGYISGTSMAFAGIRSGQERADIITYLASITENPPPLPEAEAAVEGGAETDEAAAQ
ncbi:c-type cytochrome [Salinarimonas ramus]|uniref:Cytochrome c family protein n=1 Tax=Salinarimonas ramus TaxID=690164 RepID=A0A917QBF6_9HYPH|nr:cytochrome c family protein [Salinarimonas ramus]GGK40976.1 cytochrome c family protein [Salinarimonas ramus]